MSGGQYPNDLYSTNQNKAQPNQQAHPHQSVSVPNLGDIANFIYSAAPFQNASTSVQVPVSTTNNQQNATCANQMHATNQPFASLAYPNQNFKQQPQTIRNIQKTGANFPYQG